MPTKRKFIQMKPGRSPRSQLQGRQASIRHKAEDWQPHRDFVEEQLKTNTQQQVLKLLDQQYSFRASLPGLKRQLTSWNYSKNLSQKQKEHVLRDIDSRPENPANFRVRKRRGDDSEDITFDKEKTQRSLDRYKRMKTLGHARTPDSLTPGGVVVEEGTPSTGAPTPKSLNSPSGWLHDGHREYTIFNHENSDSIVQMDDAVMNLAPTEATQKSTVAEAKPHADLVNVARQKDSDGDNSPQSLEKAHQNVNTNHNKENKNALPGDVFHSPGYGSQNNSHLMGSTIPVCASGIGHLETTTAKIHVLPPNLSSTADDNYLSTRHGDWISTGHDAGSLPTVEDNRSLSTGYDDESLMRDEPSKILTSFDSAESVIQNPPTGTNYDQNDARKSATKIMTMLKYLRDVSLVEEDDGPLSTGEDDDCLSTEHNDDSLSTEEDDNRLLTGDDDESLTRDKLLEMLTVYDSIQGVTQDKLLEMLTAYDSTEAVNQNTHTGTNYNHHNARKSAFKKMTLLKYLGDVLLGRGQYVESIEVYEQALTLIEPYVIVETHNLPHSRLLFNYSIALGKIQDFPQAIFYCTQATEGFQKLLVTFSEEMLHAYTYLGALLLMKNLYETADTYLCRALSGMERNPDFGSHHHKTLQVVSLIATNYSYAGNFDEALVFAERAVSSRLSVLGVDDPATISSTMLKVSILRKMGRCAEAIELCERSMPRQVGFFEPGLYDADPYYEMALCLNSVGEHQKACQWYDLSISAKRESCSPYDLTLCGLYHTRAGLLEAQGLNKEAFEDYNAALDGYRRVLPADDPNIADCLVGLGRLTLLPDEDGAGF